MSEMEKNVRSKESLAESAPASPGRRSFLGGVAATPLIATVAGLSAANAATGDTVTTQTDLGPQNAEQRRANAASRRRRALILSRDSIPIPEHPNNGDEENVAGFANSFHKALPHGENGLVDPAAFNAFRDAIDSGNPADFANVTPGCPNPANQRPLVDPQSAHSFVLTGPDSRTYAMPPAPAFNSAEHAGEMVEMYWAAATRDVPFSRYATDPLVNLACNELSALSDFRGPREGGQVTPRTYLRGIGSGVSVGPYMSQFLLLPATFGSTTIENTHVTYLPALNFLTDYDEWLTVQNGCGPTSLRPIDPVKRIIRNGRDLAAYVNVDALAQAYLNAVLISAFPAFETPTAGMPNPIAEFGYGAPPDENHPYRRFGTNFPLQEPLGQLGGAWILGLMWEVSQRCVAAQWYQKYGVHRRARPEYYGGILNNQLTGVFGKDTYPIHDDLLNSPVLEKTSSIQGNFLLPIAFPEGSPTHPAYGSGHATVAGGCITVLKAFFDESFPIPNPMEVSDDGLSLVPYTGADAGQMTLGGEMNKLMSNITFGRTHGGVHWRTDGTEANLLGEHIAIGLLEEMQFTYSFDFPDGFNLTRFDGTQITVGGNR